MGIVSQHISLKKSGQNFIGLCPFHSEKTPSFVVSPAKQIFHCFGCHAGGDVLTFLMKMEGKSFPETVRYLAEKLGIRIGPPSSAHREPQEDRSWIYKAHEDALHFYHTLLMKNPEGKPARDYLRHRGITAETAEAFQLGFSSSAWDALQGAMLKAGWTPSQLERAGLIIARDEKRQGSRGHYDRFRSRLLFPIMDLQGRVCGFGGRVLDPKGMPKYLNSPESPVFSKGRLLYALEKAREAIHQSGFIIVVEGYFDVIAAHQAGIKNVVATLGTALTESHLYLMKRFAQKIKLIFDPDEAGVRAALRSVELVSAIGLSTEVVQLPEGEDPDSFLKKHGGEAFRTAVNHGTRLMDFALERSLAHPDAHTIDGKLRIVQQVMPMIQGLPHPVERGHYLKKLAEELDIKEQDLREELKTQSSRMKRTPVALKPALPDRFPKEEEILIHLLIHQHLSIKQLLEEIQVDDLSDPRSRQIVKTLVDCYELSGTFQLKDILHQDVFHPELASFLTGLSVKEPDYEDRDQTMADCLRTVKKKRLQVSMKAIQSQIGLAEQEGDLEQIRNLQNQLLGIKRKSLEVGVNLPLRQTG